MYNSQEIAMRIKETSKIRKISIKQLLENCGLNINYISELAKGKQVSALNICKIADCLEISTDYLLGRTNNPKEYTNQIVNNGNTTISDNGIQANIVNNHLDECEKGLLNVFKKLSFEDKMSVINHAINLEKSYHQPKPIKYVARDLTGNNNHGNIYISNDDIKKAETDDYSKYD